MVKVSQTQFSSTIPGCFSYYFYKLAVLCDVCFKSAGSDSQIFMSGVDLDYFNIRQWRLIWFRYCDLNKNEDTRLIIQPHEFKPL